MVILTGPATDEFVGPNRRQGFLDGLKEGGLQYEIKAEQSGDYAAGQGAGRGREHAGRQPRHRSGPRPERLHGAGRVQRHQRQGRYKNVYVAASADGQKEGLGADQGGRLRGRYISTGLNSPSLAAEEALKIAVDIATGAKKPSEYPKESFTKAVGIGCDNIDEYYDPNRVF